MSDAAAAAPDPVDVDALVRVLLDSDSSSSETELVDALAALERRASRSHEDAVRLVARDPLAETAANWGKVTRGESDVVAGLVHCLALRANHPVCVRAAALRALLALATPDANKKRLLLAPLAAARVLANLDTVLVPSSGDDESMAETVLKLFLSLAQLPDNRMDLLRVPTLMEHATTFALIARNTAVTPWQRRMGALSFELMGALCDSAIVDAAAEGGGLALTMETAVELANGGRLIMQQKVTDFSRDLAQV